MDVQEHSSREWEVVPDNWKKVFQFGFSCMGYVLALVSYSLVIYWLSSDKLGGFGKRGNTVTAHYFNWHPFCMSTAFLVFISASVLSFEVLPFARRYNKTIHALLNTFAFIGMIAGFYIIYDCHNNLSSVGSFHTVHGCVGLTIIIIATINYLLGFVFYLLKIGGNLRGNLKPLHKRIGLCVLIYGFGNIALGLLEQELKKSLTGHIHQLTNAIAVMVILSAMCIVFSLVRFVDKKDPPEYDRFLDPQNK